MKASIIYAYRFLTHNKRRSIALWVSLVLAALMISICFFTVRHIRIAPITIVLKSQNKQKRKQPKLMLSFVSFYAI